MTFKAWILKEIKKEPKNVPWGVLDEPERQKIREDKIKKLVLEPWELDFAEDVARDPNWKEYEFNNWPRIERYLESKRVSKDCLAAAQSCFDKWQDLDPKAVVDGLGRRDLQRISKALRQVWGWSHPRRLVVNRCRIEGSEFSKCEKCKKKCAKVYVDHIERVGTPDIHMIARLFVPSNSLQGLCRVCHAKKTKLEKEDDLFRI